ncbi:MAG: EAL domain-containing protein [Acidobacteria bacterium]|nr:EAL domain-containing protein [Acidobacteriota bacterium]MBV9476726.1 EAL domain-containing protein [Acidobacteriota bacterium]
MPEQPTPLHLLPNGRSNARDAELEALRAELAARDRQETAIAELGQGALTGVDPLMLLGQACALVELTLQVSHCRALELAPGGGMRVRAALGANETFLHCDRDGAEDESIGMLTLLADGPVSFARLEDETRFEAPHLRHFHGIRSGAGVVIRTQYGPFGVLLAYSDNERTFAEYELAFLRSTANILGEAITRGRTEHALRSSEARLRQVIATTVDAVLTVDRSLLVTEWNRQAETTFGLAARDVIGQPLQPSLFPEGTMHLLRVAFERHRAGRPSRLLRRRLEIRARRASGEEFPAEVTIAPAGSDADFTLTAFIHDISARKEAERRLEMREQRFRTIVEKSWSGVALVDAELCFCFVGSSTQHLLGYRDDELLGRSLFDFVHPRDAERTRAIFAQIVASETGEGHGELRFRHRDGNWVWLEGFAQNLLHETSVGAVVLNYRDVSQRKETEKQLEYRAYYDSLTALPNRLLFRDRLVNAVAHARRNRVGVAVMYLDVDHFKLINDGLGHSLGDALLAEVARRLQGALRASDTISRIGGDEFSILLPEVVNTEAMAGVARKILDSLAQPFSVEGHELIVTASIGISCFPNDGDDAETLLKCADAAMYRAKELGRNQAQLFTASMNERYVRRLALEQHLHHAIERQQLELEYQPIYDRAGRRIASVEALLRWRDPNRGLVPPSEFIELAEETGMIVAIGAWVLRTACLQLRQWHDEGLTSLRMAVNISAVQLQQRDLVTTVRSAIEESGISPHLLELEITESAAMQNFESTLTVLRELRAMGVSIAVDDFGTGQSSLIYLKHFPIDTVKIDKEFLREVTFDDTAAAIVSYVINLAHTLQLKVVAEGVETEEQYTFLRHYACDLLQGYLFSRPLPPAAILPYLARALPRPHTAEIPLDDLLR